MTTGDLRYWLFWVIGLAALAAGVWIIKRTIFGDREKGTRRCPLCWYNLSHTPGRVCGECGFEAPDERYLYRVRRNWRLGLLTAFGLVLGMIAVATRISEDGWVGVAPTKLLIFVMPLADSPRGEILTELNRRMRDGDFSRGEWTMLINRSVKGDDEARPATDAWAAKYGTFFSSGSTPQWRALRLESELMRLVPRLELQTRATWPRDVPVCIEVGVTDWWPKGATCRITLTPRNEDATESKSPNRRYIIIRDPKPNTMAAFPLILPPPDSDLKSMVFDYVIESAHPEFGVRWMEVARGTEQVAIDVRDETVAEVLPAASSPTMDMMIARAMGGPAIRWLSGDLRFAVQFNPWRAMTGELDDVAIGAVIEVLHGGEIIRTSRVWWMGGTDRDQLGVELPEFHDPRLDEPDIYDGQWTLRITSDPNVALRVTGAKRHWEGEVTVRLRIIEREDEGLQFDWELETRDDTPTGGSTRR